MLNYDFSAHAALVTGGTRGIGAAIARALLAAGARVLITFHRDNAAAETFRATLPDDQAGRVLLLCSDVSLPAEATRVFTASREQWSRPLTLVVNNAGVLHQGDFLELDEKDWDRTLAVNLKGPFLLGQELLRQGSDPSAMVNISSVGGQIGGPKAPDYSASKAGLISLTRSLARLGAPVGLRVNAIAPGIIRTEIFTPEQLAALEAEGRQVIPLGRLGTPEDVARATLWLLSAESSYLTGHCLNVNGGLYFG